MPLLTPINTIEDTMNTLNTVSFTQMKDGTAADYDLLERLEKPFHAMTPDRILTHLAAQADESLDGYPISRLTHATQSATRAQADGADIDWIVATLLHDIGDGLAPQNHDRFAAEIIRPFVRAECTWVVEHHGLFQGYYYFHHYGWDRDERDKFKDHIHYQACVDFCERWDQSSFDPTYPSQDLSHFEPMVREVFARKAYDPEVIKEGISTWRTP